MKTVHAVDFGGPFDSEASRELDQQTVEQEERASALNREFPATDAGNGELFVSLYGNQVRYDHRRGRWLLWSGHFWAPDCDAGIRNLAVQAARFRYHKAETI